VEDLPAAIRDVNRGDLAERCIVGTAVESACQQALDVTGNGSCIVYMGLAGPDDIVRLPMLGSLVQDKTIAFSWLYPNQWPKTIRLLETGVIDTAKLITHSGPLEDMHRAIEQVSSREDGVIKYIVKPS
jgi:L-iditol 2-dehydrogenase